MDDRRAVEARRAESRRRRRRQGHLRLAGLIGAVVIVVVAITIAVAPSGSGARGRALGARPAGRAHAGGSPADPLDTPAMRRWLAARSGAVSIAVRDLRTGREWLEDPGARDQTASIVKADILETLLHQAIAQRTPLAEVETSTAQQMIEASNDDDASELWQTIGSNAGLDAYNDGIGMSDTVGAEDDYWGETLTSAADQITLLDRLVVPSRALSASARAYALSLMENIDPGENWGVTGGVPARGVGVALKNGWVPLSSQTDWEVNSIGWIDGDHHDYLIAVLSAHDPSENYGIDTIERISRLVYDQLGPAPRPGTATIEVTPTG